MSGGQVSKHTVVKCLLMFLLVVSFITTVMKLNRGALWTWFEHRRTPIKTASFFGMFSAVLLYCVMNLERCKT